MTIVVGFITSKEGKAALAAAIAEARLREASLIVLHPTRPARGSDSDLQADLDALRASLEASGVSHELRPIVRDIDPADDLIRVSQEVGATLLVIGLRRRTPVGKLILGSNAQRVLLDATCPVLAVKAEA